MTPVLWPAALAHKAGSVLREGFADMPANNIRRSEMDDGWKQGPKFTTAYSKIKGAWRFTSAEYRAFQVWVETELKGGVRPFVFQLPLRKYLVAAQFVVNDGRPYETSLVNGNNVIVSFEIEFLDRALS